MSHPINGATTAAASPATSPASASVTGTTLCALEQRVGTEAPRFEAEQGAAKFDLLRSLVSLHDEMAQSSHGVPSATRPLSSAALACRAGLSSLLNSKLDASVRFHALRLSRLLLQRHGPTFATVTSAALAEAAASASAKGAVHAPHVTFLQLLTNVFTIELRLTLDEFASTRDADIKRLESTREEKEALALECLELFRFTTQALVGEDDDVADEWMRPFQWWNLPMPIVMHCKQKLDQCSEAILIFLNQLQAHPTHPRSPHLVYACGSVLAQWMVEDTKTHVDAVNKVLPFLLTIPTPSTEAPSSSESVPIVVILLPALIQLAEVSPFNATLARESRLPVRLLADAILGEYEANIRQPVDWLKQLGKDDQLGAKDREELRSGMTWQLRVALHTIGTACQLLVDLFAPKFTIHQYVVVEERQAELQPLAVRARTVLQHCTDLAQQLPGSDEQKDEMADATERFKAAEYLMRAWSKFKC